MKFCDWPELGVAARRVEMSRGGTNAACLYPALAFEQGFWGRWQDYIQTGHGGNIALKSRGPNDYQDSILEVAGTASTTEEIIRMETHWKSKLQSQEMGLNRN